MTNFNAEAEGVTPDEIIRRLIAHVPADRRRGHAAWKLPDVFRSADAG